MTARALMFMGTGSDVGKSLVVAGLCRLLADRGLRVVPFKPQNMSNNAAAVEGGEIGRAQALQARAARRVPTVHMNPVLLKPESERGAQVIVQGRRAATLTAREFFRDRSQYMPHIVDSFHMLSRDNDVVLVEGAGSPAEVNLRAGDLANMGFARAVGISAILLGDIHRGGVIASIAGTKLMLDSADADLIKGFLINKLHGDPALFSEGRAAIEQATHWPCMGVIPHFADAHLLPAEDAVALEERLPVVAKKLCFVVVRLPRIANFDDLDPLTQEPDVSVRFLKPGEALQGDADLVIIPGSKSTVADLAFLRAQGWDIDIAAHHRRGGRVLGLCGGYQMLGRMIHDPAGLEGAPGSMAGLRLLDVETTLAAEKTVTQTRSTHVASGEEISAYEIHLGRTSGTDCERPFAQTTRGAEGATSSDGRVQGTYLHGCFSSDGFRRAFLSSFGVAASTYAYEATVERTLDALAQHLAQHVDIDRLLATAAQPGNLGT
jgi:adenosylcobyric acid synthase